VPTGSRIGGRPAHVAAAAQQPRGGQDVTLEIELGEIRIQQIVEQQGAFFEPLTFFPTLTRELLEENRPWLEPRYLDPVSGKIVLCIQSHVVRTRHHTILVDTCVGNHKPRPARPFWNLLESDRYQRNLAAAGLDVAKIDVVMCTHLHVDHVGWNTRLENGRWVPTFPNATYLFADRELAFWTQRQQDAPETCPWVTDSVLPIVEANRARAIRSDHELSDVVRLVPSPGHTIDHFCVQVGKAGQDALIAGDMIHSPLQARYPELGMLADYDSALAGVSRRRLLGRCCDSPTLMCIGHFPWPSLGRMTGWGEGFRFLPGLPRA
jgi:glyoxylase-like metal-dependent hydrolase (beta-lactamase superfamily II)